jgi:23S rRNA pseudouridine2605 synthase
LIRAGRVSVNGATAQLGDSADPTRDAVCLDGKRVAPEPLVYWVVHKPRGVLTTARDTHGRKTVLDLLPDCGARLFPVGRLDRDTEGLVLLTNDGALAHALLHPSHGVEREYVVSARGHVRTATLERLARGVDLEEGRTAPAGVERVQRDAKARSTRFHLTIVEGRKRQIRRAMRLLGHPVNRLVRVRFGPLRLGRLAPGQARPLSARERGSLERAARPARARRRARS